MPQATVGTDPVTLVSKQTGYLLDFIIQNLSTSAQNVYFLQSTSEDTGTGMQIIAGAWMAGQDYDRDLIVVADAINADVRYVYVRKANVMGVGADATVSANAAILGGRRDP